MDHQYIPAAKKKIAYLDKRMFATIICLIPAGKLTTSEAIYEMWAKRKGADRCEIGGYGFTPIIKDMFWTPTDVQRVDHITELRSYGATALEDMVPYWRLISPRGMLIDYGHFFDKETQKYFLEKEGHVIVQPNPDRRAYKVQNYKAALFDLDRLIIKE